MVELFKECVNSTEDLIGGPVFASKVPPGLDHSFVITIDLNVSTNAPKPWDGFDEQLEANGFRPANVPLSVEGLPSWDKAPGSPMITDGDGNPDA